MPETPTQAAARAVLDHPWAGTPYSAHSAHRFDAGCGVCRGDVPAILAVAAPHIAQHIAREIPDHQLPWLITETTTQHHLDESQTDWEGNHPCACGDNPDDWDFHWAEVSLAALAGHGLVVVQAEDIRAVLGPDPGVDAYVDAGRRLLVAVETSETAPEPTETGRDVVSQVLGSTDDPRTVETPTALPRGVLDCQVCRRQTEDREGICAVCRFVNDEELAGLRKRAEQAEAQVTRVREWAEKMRRTGNPDGMGAHIHATVIRLLDQPADGEQTPPPATTEETDRGTDT